MNLPEGGYWVQPKSNGWWTEDQVDEIWGEEAPLCLDTTAPVPTEEASFEPTEPPDPFADFFNKPKEQDLKKELENVTGLEGVDLAALLQGDGSSPNSVAPPEPDIPDFLNIELPAELVEQPGAPQPTQPPRFVVDFSVLNRKEVEEEEEPPDLTPPVCRPADGDESPIYLYMFSSNFKDPGASCIDGGLRMPNIPATITEFRDADGVWKEGSVLTSLGVEMEFRMIYRATDKAGNVSPDLVRQVRGIALRCNTSL